MTLRADLAQSVEALKHGFAPYLDGPRDVPLYPAMAYALDGGKAIRGHLVLLSAQLYDVPRAQALYPAMAVEAIHAYSLVHDDLPEMDDDDLRRGRPTVHKAWDEASAILVGDGLQSTAYEILLDPQGAIPAARAVDLAQSLAQASTQMVLGQMRDIAMETRQNASLDDIITMQRGKTGALIEWSSCAGARLAGQDPQALKTYAAAIGLAFQVADDILDVEGDAAVTGKRVGKDAGAGKGTFVSHLGLEAAKTRARDLVDEACSALDEFGAAAAPLCDVARFIIERES